MAELVDATDLIQFERYEGNLIGERFQIQGNLAECKISIGYPEPNLFFLLKCKLCCVEN